MTGVWGILCLNNCSIIVRYRNCDSFVHFNFSSQHYVFQGREGGSFKGRPDTRNQVIEEGQFIESSNINVCVIVL